MRWPRARRCRAQYCVRGPQPAKRRQVVMHEAIGMSLRLTPVVNKVAAWPAWSTPRPDGPPMVPSLLTADSFRTAVVKLRQPLEEAACHFMPASSLGMARGRSRSTLLMNIRYPTPPPPAHAHELRFTDDPLLVTAHRPLHPLLRPCPRAPDARESSFCRGIGGPDPEQHPSGRVSSSCSFEEHAGTT